MAAIATLEINLDVIGDDGTRQVIRDFPPLRWAPAVVKVESLALANGANTITPPTGAKFVLLVLGTAVSLTIKGISGDTGIALTPATAPLGIPGMFPLSSVSSFVITNGTTSQTILAVWL